MSQVLRDARRHEEEKEIFIKETDRPMFHLSSRVGWMNDPNGFSYYDGKYHLFYQYHPYDSHWGPMHWGHAESSDLLHWEYLPAALAPDTPADRDGCFSGSAIEMHGEHVLMYTGVLEDLDENGEIRHIQRQCIAFGDGREYRKYQNNPVIDESLLPEGGDRYAFRDPKIFRRGDRYCCLVANNSRDHAGQLLLFSSADALNWKYEKVFLSNDERFGLMWECPDFFELDGEHVALVSAQDMLPKGLEYHNGFGVFYMTGSFDEETMTFTERENHSVDYGIDFYAPQTILTPDGRRVMIAWMQNWDSCSVHPKQTPWFGQMTLPRELHMKDGKLYQWPAREIEEMRSEGVTHENVILENEEISLDGVEGRCLDLECEIESLDGEDVYRKFTLNFAKNGDFSTHVSFRPEEGSFKIDRKFSGSRRAIVHQRRAFVDNERGKISFRLVLDRYSAEIFINGGEKVMSATLSTPLEAEDITFRARGKLKMNVTAYKLK